MESTPNVPETIPQKVGTPGLFDLGPQDMVNSAASLATVLADVIEKQRLYTNIQGKKYVRVEAWATLGTMLGVLPREVAVTETADGSYEAIVELYSTKSGQIVGRGSAICGMDEKRWSGADRYARRSMAVTRATGKAFRLGFSWIMSLAGYQATPAEEMPEKEWKPEFDDHSRKSLRMLLTEMKVDGTKWSEVGGICKDSDPRDWVIIASKYKPIAETQEQLQ